MTRKYFEKLWVVKTAREYHKEPRLSYMAQYVEKNGEVTKETANLQETGRHWAYQPEVTRYKYKKDDPKGWWTVAVDENGNQIVESYTPEQHGEEAIIDNDWIQDFYVIALETRDRTSNRWFRVLDPRGYVFEISAENMLRIMLDGDVLGGRIRQPCRWEKKGSVFQLVVQK